MINIKKRVFLIVLDSFGIGEMPDAKLYGDEGNNTIEAVSKSEFLNVPNLKKMGLFNIDGVRCNDKEKDPTGAFARLTELSKGKDTTTGHWEIAGVETKKPFPTYKNGFPDEIIKRFEEATGRKVLCNKPYSGTEVIKVYGREHLNTKSLIVYTSADSVFQVAAHEDVVSKDELYQYCKAARNILKGQHNVSRVIARPFKGKYPNFIRTNGRHDFSVRPPQKTMLDFLSENNRLVISVGKINDIFAGQGINESYITSNNNDGMKKMLQIMDRDFEGLCFLNLVDFDMLYGHRNDVNGYAKALTKFDSDLNMVFPKLKENDILMITADHGCDPSTKSTDHSREYTPFLAFGKMIKGGTNLYTRSTFADIASTILDFFSIDNDLIGTSFLSLMTKH